VLAIVSHDLRNPLHTIRMSASLLVEFSREAGALTPAILEKQLGVISRSASRANALIQDLLDVSRIEAGSMAIATAPLSGTTLVEETAAEMGPLAHEKSVTLEHRWDGADRMVLVDRERVAQVFSNLVGNALKFTASGGRVAITGRVAGALASMAEFTVEDSGSGIPIDHLPHLFDRFWQANRASRAGAGLGLFITKGIIEAHRGEIVVESTPGVGSRFRFTIPLAGEAPVG
jgi:signal transduction histidine kinase